MPAAAMGLASCAMTGGTLGCSTHACCASLHTSGTRPSGSTQVTAVPGEQAPARHVSTPSQYEALAQELPSGFGEQVPTEESVG